MSGITTHILDISLGRPAAGVPVVLAEADGSGGWTERARTATDADGRARLAGEGTSDGSGGGTGDGTGGPAQSAGAGKMRAGEYRITFEVADYLAAGGHEVFFPRVEVQFALTRAEEHHHVPLLLSPFGYSTYRGS
jgi:5-hydroxyisourate hydrolase